MQRRYIAVSTPSAGVRQIWSVEVDPCRRDEVTEISSPLREGQT
jgi:hypothetical protein